MKDLLQHNENLLFIERFQVARARSNLVSFFRNLFLNFFGRVDPKLEIFIPDITSYDDPNSNRSIYRFADVKESIVNILSRFSEEDRKLPFIIIIPGLLSEYKFELSGDNFHFEGENGRIYGSASNTDVTFIIGAQDEYNRTKLGDLVFTSFIQFFRKNYLFYSDDRESKYSLIIKNDSVTMSTDGEVGISDFEKIYTVGVNTKIFLEWSFTLDSSLFNTHNYNVQAPNYNVQKPLGSDIYDYLNENIENIDFRDPVITKSLTTPPTSPNEGDRYLLYGTPDVGSDWEGQKYKIAEYSNGSYNFYLDSGFVVKVEDESYYYLYNSNKWLVDTYGIFG